MALPLPPPPHADMPFSMPMFKDWVPRRIQPWIYVVCVLCIQFSGGMYLGAMNDIRGTTGFMIEDLCFLLYANLAGMAVYFPLLFRMKFRFTNQQLLCTAAIVIALCNLITMHSTFLPLLMVVCFIAGMAKLQGTFEHMSNIQLWITPKRDFAVFFPVLHIILLTAIEGSGFLAAWFGYHFSWEMMHVFTIGTMCLVLTVQLVLCRPFCPLPQRLSLKGIDLMSGILISVLMLMVSYILVYGDYKMWFDAKEMRLVAGASLVLFAIILHRLTHHPHPYVHLRIFRYRNVVPILLTMAIGEVLLGCEHTLEEVMYEEIYQIEELTKETQMVWALWGIYLGVAIDLYWLKVKKWKVWKLFGIGFSCILAYAVLMYFTIDVNVNLEQYHLPTILRGCAYAILAASLMWSLDESIHDLEEFFMGLFVFNIIHMYLAGALGYGVYTTFISNFLNDNLSRYGGYLTTTHGAGAILGQHPEFMTDFVHSMMAVSLKQIYGLVVWVSGTMSLLFFLMDIPAVRTNVRKMPLWPVYGIKMLYRSKEK